MTTADVQWSTIMPRDGYSFSERGNERTFFGRFVAWRERYRVQTSASLAVLASLTFIAAEIVPAIQELVSTSGLLQYVTLIVLLDLAATVHLQQRAALTSFAKDQDNSMPKLIEAVTCCRNDSADLLEYAAATTLPLIRAIRREGVPMRLLVKHPSTVTGLQRHRMITALDTIYNSIFENYSGDFEIRCYKLPFTLRGRRLGKELLELGWLTPDVRRQTAYGHANPSVLADLSSSENDFLVAFFGRTFKEYWDDSDTEDARIVLERLKELA